MKHPNESGEVSPTKRDDPERPSRFRLTRDGTKITQNGLVQIAATLAILPPIGLFPPKIETQVRVEKVDGIDQFRSSSRLVYNLDPNGDQRPFEAEADDLYGYHWSCDGQSGTDLSSLFTFIAELSQQPEPAA